jgi:exonuclease V gamma subunit
MAAKREIERLHSALTTLIDNIYYLPDFKDVDVICCKDDLIRYSEYISETLLELKIRYKELDP